MKHEGNSGLAEETIWSPKISFNKAALKLMAGDMKEKL
jgi:hypothetical protein